MPRPLANALESLDQLKSALKIVAALGDGAVGVPALRAATGTAIEIIEIAQAVTKNKQDAREVAKSAAERTSSLLDAFKGKSQADIPLDLQQDITRYAQKLELVQKILRKHATEIRLWRRVLARISDRDEINQCKDILNESFQVFEVALTLKLHTRLPDLLGQLQACIIAQAPVQPKLSVIRREELDLLECWRLDALSGVVSAEYNGNRVVVKKYGADKKQWAADIDSWLQSDAWQPHYLQIIGQSEENACAFYIVFRDPGIPVQNYIESGCRSGVKKCSLEVLTMVKQFASAADELLRKDRGGCKLDTAKVCLRLTGDMNRPNFVLAHFDPSHFYEPTANDRDIVANGWDIFVNLITKAITGNRSKPNYVTGSHRLSLIVLAFYPFLHRIPGATGPTVTRVFRFLIHFLIDFRYHPERQHDGLNQTFRKLSSEIKSLESDIESLDSSSNPLLDSMQRYSSSLCAIWDLWEVIPATPGDLGIMIPGDDPRRPRFKKIVNLTVNIQAWLSELGQAPPMVTSYPEYAEQQYVPSDSCWSSDPLDALTIRHTLRLGSASISEPSMFVFSRARRISLLGNSWNYHAAWSYLRHISNTGELSALAAEHHIDPEDLILTFSSSQSKGYAHIILKTAERRGDLLAEVGAKGGLLYYFENLAAVEGELCGYWSSCEAPGQPLWGGLPQSPGPDWGWEYSDGDFKVEIGRTGPVQHIRYVSL